MHGANPGQNYLNSVVYNCFLRSVVKESFEQANPKGLAKDHSSLNIVCDSVVSVHK